MCNLRHCRRRSGPCFLHFPSLSPKNLIPVVSTSKCSTNSARAVLCRSAKPNRFLSVQQNWIAASEMLRTASAFATCRGKPAHALVQPHRQRASSFEGCVVLPPVAGSIAGDAGLTHAASLPLEEQQFMQQRQQEAKARGVDDVFKSGRWSTTPILDNGAPSSPLPRSKA